jgi:hypothetical protein
MAFHIRNCVGTRDDRSSRFSGWPVHSPADASPGSCGRPRTAQGRCGSLLLHRKGLAPSTSCRPPGALRKSSQYATYRRFKLHPTPSGNVLDKYAALAPDQIVRPQSCRMTHRHLPSLVGQITPFTGAPQGDALSQSTQSPPCLFQTRHARTSTVRTPGL